MKPSGSGRRGAVSATATDDGGGDDEQRRLTLGVDAIRGIALEDKELSLCGSVDEGQVVMVRRLSSGV